MANTTGGSFWKSVVEFGSDLVDDVSDWWNNVPEGPSFLNTGIGGRPISGPDSDLGNYGGSKNKGQQGWQWLTDIGSDVIDYGMDAYDYAKDLYGDAKDLYGRVPDDLKKYGSDYILKKLKGDPNDGGKDRPRPTHKDRKLAQKYMGGQSLTPGFGVRRNRTQFNNTRAAYGQSPVARKAMQLAAMNEKITQRQLEQIQRGRITIGLNQVNSTSPRLVGRFTQNIK